MKTLIYKNQFYRLKEYIEDFYEVQVYQEAGQDDTWEPNEGVIKINKNLKYRERLFSLLHELGHVIIDSSVKFEKPICFNKIYPEIIKSKNMLIHTINEEVLAWNKGKEVATLLNFKYNENDLDEYMTKCIMSYIKSGLKDIYKENINIDFINAGI